MTASEKFTTYRNKTGSSVCLALDVVADTPSQMRSSIRRAVFMTHDLVGCYKLNMAFFEATGGEAYEWLTDPHYFFGIPQDCPIILDAKRGDVGHSAEQYAKAWLRGSAFDAITVNPYFGRDGIVPFASYKDKLTFVVVASSNPSASEIQDANPYIFPTFLLAQQMVNQLQEEFGNLGVVAPATHPDRLKGCFLVAAQDGIPQWFLIPGLGAQGAKFSDLPDYIQSYGRALFVVGRDILFAEDIRTKAQQYRDELRAQS